MNLIYTISNDWYGTTIHIHLNINLSERKSSSPFQATKVISLQFFIKIDRSENSMTNQHFLSIRIVWLQLCHGNFLKMRPIFSNRTTLLITRSN